MVMAAPCCRLCTMYVWRNVWLLAIRKINPAALAESVREPQFSGTSAFAGDAQLRRGLRDRCHIQAAFSAYSKTFFFSIFIAIVDGFTRDKAARKKKAELTRAPRFCRDNNWAAASGWRATIIQSMCSHSVYR